MATLDEIRALADKVDGPLWTRRDERGHELWQLVMTRQERNIIADALTVLYGHEKKALTAG